MSELTKCPHCWYAGSEDAHVCVSYKRGLDDLIDSSWRCNKCGRVGTAAEIRTHDCDPVLPSSGDQGGLSVDTDTILEEEHYKDQFTSSQLDELVASASGPNLAALFRKAKERGVITPAKEYGDSNS